LVDAPEHPTLANGIMFGVRVARPIFPWLVPELELAASPTKTDRFDVSVFWLNPRAQIRFEITPGKRVRPFAVIGGGGPLSLSSKKGIFNTAIVADGYLGGGVAFTTERGFDFRLDVRASIMPGVKPLYTVEYDIGLGLSFRLGKTKSVAMVVADPAAPGLSNPDIDGDGILNAVDACADRAEDADGFEDTDGCPDIDNDLDSVLDIADKCLSVPETFNGFADDDGCPDTVPPEAEAVVGTIEGLIYGNEETEVRDRAKPALDRVAVLLQKFPTMKIVIIGHTDDAEAKPKAAPVDGDAPVSEDALAEELATARAEAVRQFLVRKGVPQAHMEVEGKGRAEPVGDNKTPRGRLSNRRVEIKLFIPRR
jgi:OmpA-OmpF porin, OOP family